MPAHWACAIWFVIYFVQFVWIVYGMFALFRKTSNGSYLYLKPDYMCWGMYVCAIVNFFANIGWCFLSYSVGWALITCLVMTCSLYIFLFISCRKLMENQSELQQLGFVKDIGFVRIFIQNGCAIYATWISFVSILYMGKFLTTYAQVDQVNASTFSLIVCLLATINYFIFENFVWRDYLRYMFTPYFVICWGLVAILTNNMVGASQMTRNNILTMIIIVVVVCLIVARLILNFFYKSKYPEGFNFNKLIKVNKIFKSSRNGSEQEHVPEPSEQA